jgi:hypothetical protein
MTYLHLNPHIRCCVYQGEVIVLDLLADRYIFLDTKDSETFLYIIGTSFIKNDQGWYTSNEKNSNFDEPSLYRAILDLREAGILSSSDFPAKFPEIIHHANEGMDNIDWSLTTKLSEKTESKTTVTAYFYLVKVFFDMKLRGLNYLIQKIRSHKKVVGSEVEDISDLVVALNKACFYFPIRVKCLEWSFALYFLARKYSVNCQFVVGLQNYPFKSHAWIEYKNRIVADSPTLNEALAIIIREPT